MQTVVVIILMAFEVAMSQGCRRTRNDSRGETVSVTEPHRRIRLGPTRLEYYEDENMLVLYAEMAAKYDIVYVPSERKWRRVMADWASRRRDEIMGHIKRLAANRPIKWIDDDT